MAGKTARLVAVGASALIGFSATAQEPSPPNRPSKPDGLFVPPPDDLRLKIPDRPKRRAPVEDARRAFENAPPEQREKFRENLERWKNMSQEERDALRDHAEFRRARIAREIEEAIKQTGLQLDADRRQVFTLRYGQERRKIEEQLRKEMEEKRKPLLEQMVVRLKSEFSSAAPSPSASPKP